MARNTFLSWSTTANDNTDIAGINIGEGCPPSNLNNADRATMAILRRDLDGKVVYSAKGTDYLAVADDNNAVFRFTAAGTLSLTAAATLAANWHITVIADGSDVTIDPNGSEQIDDSATLVVKNGFSVEIVCSGTAFFTNNPMPALWAASKWQSRGIGEIYYVDTSIAGVDIPPSTTTDTVWIELTAGLITSGFNNGKLTSESVSGSAPLVSATAVVAFAGSPINGKTIRLLNSEGRILRPSTNPGTLQNDQIQGFHLASSGGAKLSAVTLQITGGSTPAPFNTGSDYFRPVDDGTNGTPRIGTETRMKNIGVKAYMRIA